MLIYEYFPRDLARLGVVAKAAGLDHRRIPAQVCLARERAGRARTAPSEPHPLSEVSIAQLRRLQWERIAGLMEKERTAACGPSRDSRVIRYETRCLQRLMTDVAEAERSGVAAPKIWRYRVCRTDTRPTAGSRSPDTPATAVHLMAASPGEAAARAWAIHGKRRRPPSTRWNRIASVAQILPEPGELF